MPESRPQCNKILSIILKSDRLSIIYWKMLAKLRIFFFTAMTAQVAQTCKLILEIRPRIPFQKTRISCGQLCHYTIQQNTIIPQNSKKWQAKKSIGKWSILHSACNHKFSQQKWNYLELHIVLLCSWDV